MMVGNNPRLRSILKRGRYHLTCALCGGLDHETEVGDLNRTHCIDCELLLWDSRHMVENDNGVIQPLREV